MLQKKNEDSLVLWDLFNVPEWLPDHIFNTQKHQVNLVHVKTYYLRASSDAQVCDEKIPIHLRFADVFGLNDA